MTDYTLNAINCREEGHFASDCPKVKNNLRAIGKGGKVVILAIGEGKTTLKIDQVEADVDFIVVPDHIQSIPVIVGQSLLNQSTILVIVSGKNVHIHPRDDNVPNILDLPTRIIHFGARCSAKKTVAVIEVVSRGATTDNV
ncbi:unnamed protein product [Ceutorhynchus assimilis]|uniref:CCHC-type domain-containing protein n=1 Tax=Ceutorhynchus assimilis TaxID=467358 RepID=A0A9N9MMH8_9CUCU|nr:unnamed protein product [Ceutorhynchus assimilis]